MTTARTTAGRSGSERIAHGTLAWYWYPVMPIHPMEFYRLGDRQKPRIFDLKVDKPGMGRWDVPALFGWGAELYRTELTAEWLDCRWLAVFDYTRMGYHRERRPC